MDTHHGAAALDRGRPSDFGRFWTAQAVSLTGEQVRELALPLAAITLLHASASELGLLGLGQWLPFLILAVPLGVLIDRSRRLRLLALTEFTRAVLSAAVVATLLLGLLTVPLLTVAVFVLGCFAVLYEVGYQSAVPQLVPSEGLERANARLQATLATAQVGGPGIAGLLVQIVGAPATLAVNSAAYLVSGVALTRIKTTETRPDPSGASFMADLRAGVSHVRHDRYLLANLGFSALYNPFGQWIVILLTLHAVRTLHIGAGGIGLVFALGALGAIGGAIGVDALQRRFATGQILLGCAILECGVLLLIPAVSSTWSAPAIIAALSGIWAANGAATAASGVILTTIRQVRTPERLLGRVNATMRAVTYGTVALGSLAGGIVGQLLGTGPGLLVGALLCLVTIVWVAASPLRRITTIESLAVR